MRRWRHIWLGLAALGATAHAAEPELAIELPDVQLDLPITSPPHFQKEGLPYLTENELVTELLTLIGAQDYQAALAAVREEYGPELALLEAGDPADVLAARARPGRLTNVVDRGGPRPLEAPVPAGGDGMSAAVLFLVGHVYLSLERYTAAEAALKAALVPLPDYLRVHESLALLYMRAERYPEARVHLNRAAELGLNTPSLHASLGYVNALAENWWGAASAYAQALAMEHDNRNWQSGLLQALNETQQYAAGLALVEQMLQDEPDEPDLWLYRAHMSLNAQRRELALTSLETAIRLGEDSVGNKQVAATLHMELGSIARAVELLKSASAEDLEFQFVDQALTWLGREQEWDYFRELLESIDESREPLTDSERSRLLTHRATLALEDGNPQAATASLREAVQLDASNAEALMALGQVYRDDRDYTRAELMFQRASTFDLYRESALVSLAQLAIDQENFERALTLLRDVVSRNSARTDLQRNIDVLENLVLAQSE